MEIVQVSRTDGTTTSYIVEKDDSGDGTLILRRDTSAEDIMRREGGRPMTDAEFEQHFGDLPSASGTPIQPAPRRASTSARIAAS